jgi:hypothetical protein
MIAKYKTKSFSVSLPVLSYDRLPQHNVPLESIKGRPFLGLPSSFFPIPHPFSLSLPLTLTLTFSSAFQPILANQPTMLAISSFVTLAVFVASSVQALPAAPAADIAPRAFAAPGPHQK